MFRFAHTYLFILLAAIPLLGAALALFLVWQKKTLRKYGDWAVVKQLVPDHSRVKTGLKFIVVALALAFLVIALAGPQTGSRLVSVKRQGIDLMICLDVSSSMLAQDIRPNRIERAKQSITRLIDNLEGDRIGVVVFAGKAYTQLPITTDYNAAKMFVSSITTGMVPTQGTSIADALETAAAGFGESNRNKAVVIITDGEDHEGEVLEKADEIVKKNIQIYTIGMGLPEGTPIPVFSGDRQTGYKTDRDGKTIMSRLNETLLQQLAGVGKGIYVRATTAETGLKKIYDDIGKIEKSQIEDKLYSDYEEQYQYFAGLALLLLVLDLFIFERKTRWIRRFNPFEIPSK